MNFNVSLNASINIDITQTLITSISISLVGSTNIDITEA